MFSKNKLFLVAALAGALLTSASFTAHADDSSDYGFPYDNPLVATFLSAANGLDIKPVTAEIEPMPSRENFPLLKNRNKVELGLFIKSHVAPLAFVITGAGSDAMSGSAFVLATELQKQGYNVVTLPDPVSWTYVVGVSQSALPGYMPRDAEEYYNFLKQVSDYLTTHWHLQNSGYSVLGYSYGGLVAAYLADVDSRQHVFNFDRVVAINPAVDVGYALETLDKYYAAGDRLTSERKQYLMGGIDSIASNLLATHTLNDKTVTASMQQLKISKRDLEWIIGASYRNDLRYVIFTSQQINDLGILKTPATSLHMNAREDEAASFSFQQYMNLFVLPSVAKEYFPQSTTPDAQAILASTSLYKLADLLQTNTRIYVMDNSDDILIKPGDVDFLKSHLGNRLYLYPHGGHIGNIAYPKNLKDLDTIMTKAN